MPVHTQVGDRGQFDVLVDGELVASRSRGLLVRLLGMGWPHEDDVVQAVRRRQSGSARGDG